MGIPTLKLVFDRRHRASSSKEGAIELRITYQRKQKHATTGVRVLPKQWRGDRVVNRLDAYELNHALDLYVTNARKVLNELMEAGALDMQSVVSVINGSHRGSCQQNVPCEEPLIDFMRRRAEVRKYGRADDSRERYDRFIRWFDAWGVMRSFADITQENIIKMDAELSKRNMAPNSKWHNYHRFLNGFIIDAMDEGLMRRNPYKSGINIRKVDSHDGLAKYLTREEFARMCAMELPTQFLEHARDLFVFQVYTCMAYVDMAAFDPERIEEVNGRRMYKGKRGKTDVGFEFLLMRPAMDILAKYGGRLPMMSNQKYNDQLKVLAVMAGINKPVSSHWARHTGATLLLNSGVDMEVVARILGHSSTRMTREVYAKMLDSTIADAMAGVEGKF